MQQVLPSSYYQVIKLITPCLTSQLSTSTGFSPAMMTIPVTVTQQPLRCQQVGACAWWALQQRCRPSGLLPPREMHNTSCSR